MYLISTNVSKFKTANMTVSTSSTEVSSVALISLIDAPDLMIGVYTGGEE